MNTIKLTVKCPHLIFAKERKEKKITISYNEQRCKYIKTRSDLQYIFYLFVSSVLILLNKNYKQSKKSVLFHS